MGDLLILVLLVAVNLLNLGVSLALVEQTVRDRRWKWASLFGGTSLLAGYALYLSGGLLAELLRG